MSTSTDALLMFGVQIHSEGEDCPWEAYSEPEKWLAAKYGLPEEQLPVEVVYHCHIDYPIAVLIIKGSLKKARRGYPILISDPELQELVNKSLAENWVAKIQEAKELLGLTSNKEEVGWILASYWA